MSDPTLYYIHDPMCSWCYGLAPTLAELYERLPPGIAVERLLGGLAPDTDEPMPDELREHLGQTWRRIEQRIPGTVFDHGFWRRCVPRRSTWPACRAVIAAREQDPAFDPMMTATIQRAYYREARNPSDDLVLMALAHEIGADVDRFTEALNAKRTRTRLEHEIATSRALGVDSFPALVFDDGTSHWRIPVDYIDAAAMLGTIDMVLADL